VIVRRLDPRTGFYRGLRSGLSASCYVFSVPEDYQVGSIGRAWVRVGDYIHEAMVTLEKEVEDSKSQKASGATVRKEAKTGEYTS